MSALVVVSEVPAGSYWLVTFASGEPVWVVAEWDGDEWWHLGGADEWASFVRLELPALAPRETKVKKLDEWLLVDNRREGEFRTLGNEVLCRLRLGYLEAYFGRGPSSDAAFDDALAILEDRKGREI